MATAREQTLVIQETKTSILLEMTPAEADAVHRLIGHHTAGGGPTQMLLENIWREIDDLRPDDAEDTQPLTKALIDNQYQRNPVLDIKS